MNEDIKRKIKKLLALSKSQNENEAMAALEKARKLMEESGLSEAVCKMSTAETKIAKIKPAWQIIIAKGVAWINGVVVRTIIENKSHTVRFHGSETDCFIAKEMYGYLVKTVNRMARQNIRKNAKKPFINSYKEGMAYSLYGRLEKAGALYSWANKRDSQLEEIQKAVVELYAGYKNSYLNFNEKFTKKINRNAFSKGLSAGKDVSLNRQATGGKKLCLGM